MSVLPPEFDSTIQHLDLINAKRKLLDEALANAEDQFIFAVRRAWEGGRLTYRQLVTVYELMNPNGRRYRWLSIMPFSYEKARAQAAREPDPDGSWRGTNPIDPDSAYPLSGTPVVYVLFGADHEPVYVGSTSKFKERMNNHRKNGKTWAYWEAHPCKSREHAYALEADYLRQYMPKLNVQGPQSRKADAA